jgi:NADPH-dependent glutamate synthase beta subunit-like oxidoreductase/NAD-dependent dihydropyrimidine dehydrogenase PreA subunit
MANITIDGQKIEAQDGKTILAASIEAEIYIPHLCCHPQLDAASEVTSEGEIYIGGVAHRGEAGAAFEGCNLCLVQIEGKAGLQKSCKTLVENGMIITTASPELKKARQDNLKALLEKHPHACLLCAQSDGCDRINCSSNIPQQERCCDNFGKCELQKVAQYMGTETGLPPYKPLNLPILEDEPLLLRNYNLCIGCLRCVRVCKDVKGSDALGFVVEDGRVYVGSKAPTLKESGCQFCGYCIEVCPTGALKDRDTGVGERQTYLIPCKNGCPAGTDIPRYIRHIRDGKPGEALKVIYEKLPLPESLGRVCFHPCETNCRRSKIDQSVAICSLKRTAADLGRGFRPIPDNIKKTGKKAAIIGSGPAGLSAAYYLSILGHSAAIFEALPAAGGMLRVGIPDYRLPREILDREIRIIEDAGVEIKLNQNIASVEGLLSQGFDAVFVGVGAHKGSTLGIPGEENDGVIDGVTFLRKVNLGEKVDVGNSVAIIGGGNVAMDSARSALRMGAKTVTILYRRTREEMPAYEEEIEAALEEGVEIQYLTTPVKVEKKDGALSIEFIRMELGEPDNSGRRRPVPVAGSEYSLTYDTLIAAIGQQVVLPEGVSVKKENPSKAVFMGGDALTGPASVIDAIAGGRKAAKLIDQFLGGDGNIDQVFAEKEAVKLFSGRGAVDMLGGRVVMPMLSPQDRISGFVEVCLGLDADAAVSEAKRCLGCDLRFLIKPSIMPPEQWLNFDEDTIASVPELEGVYVLYDANKEIYNIVGVINLREGLTEELEAGRDAKYFIYELDPMYTGKERQLVQQYMKQHGKMPPGADDLDDLF